MFKRAFCIFMIAIFIITILVAYNTRLCTPKIIEVPGSEYKTIQEAINAADPGDTIFIKNGTYVERVEVNKTVLLVGESMSGVMIQCVEEEPFIAIMVIASDVAIANLTIRGVKEISTQVGLLVANVQNVYLTNLIIENNYYGVRFNNVNSSKVYNCILRENVYAVSQVSNSQNNTFFGNNIVYNQYGVWMEKSCCDNWFYCNNFVDNTYQVDPFNSGTNTKWNSTEWGNYWSDYKGSDNNNDGIGDTPHQTGGAIDYLPLMQPYKPIPPIPPIAKFRFFPQEPTVGETVVFNASESYDPNPNGRIVGYSWNFGDGNTATTNEPIITHAYWKVGNFNITLTVTNKEGLKDTHISQVNVKKETSALTVSANPTEVYWGQEITITGKLTPEKEGQNITLKYMVVYETTFQFFTWRTLATVKTNRTGNYIYEWNTSKVKPALYIILVTWPGDETTTNSTNTTGILRVNKLSSNISITVEPEKIVLGLNITIKGSLTPAKENVTVSIQISKINGPGSWNLTAQTVEKGFYSIAWKPPETGNYTIKAFWQGDDYTELAQSKIKIFTVEQSSENGASAINFQYAALIALIVAALVILAVFQIKKKGKYCARARAYRRKMQKP
jgi:hypothetical protein